MSEAYEPPTYYAYQPYDHIGASRPYSYYNVPDSDEPISVVCGDEEITVTYKGLFRLLKWAYGQTEQEDS